MSNTHVKCVGAQWLVRLYKCLSDSPDVHVIVNWFLASGIHKSIDQGTPCVTEEVGSTEEEVDSSEEEVDSTAEESNDEEQIIITPTKFISFV